MKLGATEKHLKSYDYFRGPYSRQGSIIVTDRRIVHSIRDRWGEKHSDIRIEDIRSIEAGYRKDLHGVKWLVMLIIGSLMLILGSILALTVGLILLPVGIVFAIVAVAGFVLTLIGLLNFLIAKRKVYMVITTDNRQGIGMDVYASNRLTQRPILKKYRIYKTWICIDDITARKIVDEVSAIVWELQKTGTASDELLQEVDTRAHILTKLEKYNSKLADKAANEAAKLERKEAIAADKQEWAEFKAAKKAEKEAAKGATETDKNSENSGNKKTKKDKDTDAKSAVNTKADATEDAETPAAEDTANDNSKEQSKEGSDTWNLE